jgi:hypothetical protein
MMKTNKRKEKGKNLKIQFRLKRTNQTGLDSLIFIFSYYFLEETFSNILVLSICKRLAMHFLCRYAFGYLVMLTA